jgi:hypothetical protein
MGPKGVNAGIEQNDFQRIPRRGIAVERGFNVLPKSVYHCLMFVGSPRSSVAAGLAAPTRHFWLAPSEPGVPREFLTKRE